VVLAAGVAFALTACSFGLMHLKQLRATMARQPSLAEDPWLMLLDRHGGLMLSISLTALMLAAAADVVWEYAFNKTKTDRDTTGRGPSEHDQGGSET